MPNDAYGDPRNYDPNDTYWNQNDYDSTWGAPQDASQPAPYTAPESNGYPYGIPPNGGNVAGYMDISYWNSRGVPTDQIFDVNTGQLKPGWSRTGNGYERTGGGSTSTPPPTNTGGDIWPYGTGGGGTGGDYGDYGADFKWPTFNAPQYTHGPSFAAPAPFQYDAFKQPEFGDIYNDPSYKGRRDEGLNAIEHGAAAKGLTRLPQTLKALGGWNQDFASREYGNIFDRAAQTYGINRNNAADAYSTNYGISRDVFDRNEAQNLNTYDRNYRSAKDAFDLNEFQPAKMTFDDMWRRYQADLDANTRIATSGD